MKNICLILVLMPLLGSVLSGFFRKQFGRVGAHSITIFSVAVSFVCSLYLAKLFLIDGQPDFNENLYTWASGAVYFPYHFNIGLFLINYGKAVVPNRV